MVRDFDRFIRAADPDPLVWRRDLRAKFGRRLVQERQSVDLHRHADPRTKASAAASPLFYGMNGHMAWGSGIYNTMSRRRATRDAQGPWRHHLSLRRRRRRHVDDLANALKGRFKGSGVTIIPVINPRSAGWDQTVRKSAAYTLGYALAVKCHEAAQGPRQYIECGNELDTVGLKISGDGSSRPTGIPLSGPSFRGVIRGMIDGVKAVDSDDQVRRERRHPDGVPRAADAMERHLAERHSAGSSAPRTCAGTSRRITGTRARATSSAADATAHASTCCRCSRTRSACRSG